MNRRGFFGTVLGGAVAGPAIAKEALAVPSATASIGSLGMELIAPSLDMVSGLAPAFGKIKPPFNFGGGPYYDHRTYRTGHPDIDALRSVSGVYKAMMEKRKDSI